MDNELFELCKEVYKRFTEWKLNKQGSLYYVFIPIIDSRRRVELYDKYKVMTIESIIVDYGYDFDKDKESFIPLYTSDYLLPKLLPHTNINFVLQASGETLLEYALEPLELEYIYGKETIIALLKLVIALDDAGIKL